jgi:hypothetical protein
MKYWQIAEIRAQIMFLFVQYSLDMHSVCAYKYHYAQVFAFFVHIVSNMHTGCASAACIKKRWLRYNRLAAITQPPFVVKKTVVECSERSEECIEA